MSYLDRPALTSRRLEALRAAAAPDGAQAGEGHAIAAGTAWALVRGGLLRVTWSRSDGAELLVELTGPGRAELARREAPAA